MPKPNGPKILQKGNANVTDTPDILDQLANAPPPKNDLDELMDRNPLELDRTHIDAIIAYHRNLRALKDEGKGKAARRASAGPGPEIKLDLQSLGLSKAPVITNSPLKRRI